MNINLEKVFCVVLAAFAVLFAVLCLLKPGASRIRGAAGAAARALRETLTYASAQIFLTLAFLLVYVLYVKNGYQPSPADLGVAFCFVSVIVYGLLWRFGALSDGALTLVPPLAYSLFLLLRWSFVSGGAIGVFGYVMFNPVFGFIGADFAGGEKHILYAVSALLPFACAALGRGIGVHRAHHKKI